MQEVESINKDSSIKYDYKYHSGKNKNLYKAFMQIINNSSKRIYLDKVQNIIIDDKDKKDILKDLKKCYKKININKNTSIVISEDSIEKIMKINKDYKYIDSILKKKKFLLKDFNKKKKVPIIKISNKELIFIKYYYLQR